MHPRVATANQQDADLLFRWIADPAASEALRLGIPTTRPEFEKWFSDQHLRNTLSIVEAGEGPVGCIIVDDSVGLFFVLAPEQRGKRLSFDLWRILSRSAESAAYYVQKSAKLEEEQEKLLAARAKAAEAKEQLVVAQRKLQRARGIGHRVRRIVRRWRRSSQ